MQKSFILQAGVLLIVLLASGQVTGKKHGGHDDDHDEALEPKHVPDFDQLPTWQAGDWNPLSSFINSEFTEKGYMFNSDLAKLGTEDAIFGPNWYDTNVNTEFYGKQNPGVPGPFSTKQPFSYWGGENAPHGYKKYSALMEWLGNGHLWQIHLNNTMHHANPDANLEYVTDMKAQFLEGSSHVFAWFVQVVDNDGNLIDYSQDHPLIQQLAQLSAMMIWGRDGSPQGDGSIDPQVLMDSMVFLIESFGQSDEHKQVLYGILNRLVGYLTERLMWGTGRDLPLLSWHEVMDTYQWQSTEIYLKMRELYSHKRNKSKYNALKVEVNDLILRYVERGRQISAFFATVMSFADFMDKFYIPFLPNDEYALPIETHDQVIADLHEGMKRWYKQTNTWVDNAKARVSGDDDMVRKTFMTIINTCNYIALDVAVAMDTYHNLVMKRGLFDVIRQIPLPPQA